MLYIISHNIRTNINFFFITIQSRKEYYLLENIIVFLKKIISVNVALFWNKNVYDINLKNAKKIMSMSNINHYYYSLLK